MAWNDYWDLTFTYTTPRRSSSYYAPNVTYPNGASPDGTTTFSMYNCTFTVVTSNNCSAEPRSYGDYHSDYSFMNGSSTENILQYGLSSTGNNSQLDNWLSSNSSLKTSGFHYAVPLHNNGNVTRGDYNRTSSFVTEPLTHFIHISGYNFSCGIVIKINLPNSAGAIYPIIAYNDGNGLPGQTTIYGYQKHILKVTNTSVSATSPVNPVVTFSTYQQQQQQQLNNAWSSISSLSVPDVNSTTKESAQSTFNSAQSYYNVATNAGSSFTNYDNIISKYNSIKSAYDNIVARDARLTKKADKTELNTADTKARVEYTTSYTKGTEDYTALKAALAAANKRMKL